MKIFLILNILFLGLIARAEAPAEDEVVRTSCSEVATNDTTDTIYTATDPSMICLVRVGVLNNGRILNPPNPEQNDQSGLNQVYEIALKNRDREIWKTVRVKNSRIMCVRAPCPYGTRISTLKKLGVAKIVETDHGGVTKFVATNNNESTTANIWLEDINTPKNLRIDWNGGNFSFDDFQPINTMFIR